MQFIPTYVRSQVDSSSVAGVQNLELNIICRRTNFIVVKRHVYCICCRNVAYNCSLDLIKINLDSYFVWLR